MSNLLIALQITALGMGLVFAAIVLLWWMMAALTSVLAEKESTSEAAVQPASSSAAASKNEDKARAAAVAVAIALAEQDTYQARPLATPPTAIVSAWQLGMRMRQLTEKGKRPSPSRVRLG